MFSDRYPLLANILKICSLENGLDLTQIRGIVRNQVRATPKLAEEIEAAFSNHSLSWRELLDSPELGEIYPADNELLARSYAEQLLLKEEY